MNHSLGRLEKIDLREVWGSESGDFTPWLGQDENIQLLGEAIGLDLEVEAQEKNVGPFRADLLCKDTVSGSWVLVENQLEVTDHKHLGQLLTYAAGLNAVTVVWVARNFTEEHRATLDWLNEITDERFNFFGLEIELWRIGGSSVAPKFNIVSKPNDWAKTVISAASRMQSEDLTDTKKLQLNYWTQLRDYLNEQKSSVKPQKPQPQHWMTFAIGRSDFCLTATVNTRDDRISVAMNVTGPTSKAFYHLLKKQQDEIETELGFTLQWLELPTKKESRVQLEKDANPLSQGEWSNQHKWMKENLEALQRVFAKRIKLLNASEYTVEEESKGNIMV